MPDDIGPRRARADAKHARGGVERDVIERAHVDLDPLGTDRVAAHAVPRAGDRDAQAFAPRPRQQRRQLRFRLGPVRGDRPDLGDRGGVEPTGIIRQSRGERFALVAVARDGSHEMNQRRREQRHHNGRENEDTGPCPSTPS